MLTGTSRIVVLFVVALGALVALGPESWADRDSNNPSLVIIVEGLRPEFLTRSLMPNLHALTKRGVLFNGHHAVYPTLSGVNAASIVTGAYPQTHGLLGDTILLPEVDAKSAFDMQEIDALRIADDATNGGLLTTSTLGGIFGSRDMTFLVMGSGSSVTPYLLSRGFEGGAVIHPEFSQPESLRADIIEALGAPRDESGRTTWLVDAYLDVGLPKLTPDLAMLWLAESGLTWPDLDADDPRRVEGMRIIDVEVGRILKRHKKLRMNVNVFVTSDRGASTRVGNRDLSQFLIDEGLKADLNSRDVVVLDNGSVVVEGHDRNRIRQIVERLQRVDWVGAIYTQQRMRTHPESFVPGALSFQAVYMAHPRTPDILVEPAWSKDENDHDGGTIRGFGKGEGGSSSPFDLDVVLVAAGPDIKRGVKSGVPSAHIDLAPTLCFLRGIDPPATMDGRVLHEALRGGPKPESIEVLHRRHGSQADWDGGRYRIIMTESSVDGVDYLAFTKVEGL